MKRKKDMWDRLEVKTGKQISLWIVTIVVAVLFGNNVADVLINVTQEPLIFGTLYFASFFVIRVILGYLLD